jgi:segregation and condensation protein A
MGIIDFVDEDFEERPVRQSDELNLTLDGWEGPLDLLLNLARAQKVDLAQISILELVEQYLTYLAEARALKLEIAADYLVMAAWLAYLKSCLLLPKDPEQDPSPEEIALRLQLRLQRLDAMREAGARLLGRDRVGRDVFLRGAPEGLRLVRKAMWRVRDFDLFAGYGAVRARNQPAMHVVHARSVMTLDEAIERVSKMIGLAIDWTRLESFLPATQDLQLRRSALASSFLAALELARRGRLDIAQDAPFAPIRLKVAALWTSWRARSKRPCSLRRRRSASTRSPSMSARERSRSLWVSSRSITKVAASSSSSVAGAGISRPRRTSPICCAAHAKNRGGCRARRPRLWRLSPIMSRSAAPKSKRSAASRSPRARSTC